MGYACALMLQDLWEAITGRPHQSNDHLRILLKALGALG